VVGYFRPMNFEISRKKNMESIKEDTMKNDFRLDIFSKFMGLSRSIWSNLI
jgi:hypothetical protein